MDKNNSRKKSKQGAKKLIVLPFIIIYTLLSVSGLIFVKLGSTNGITKISFDSGLLLQIPWQMILGFGLYVCSFLFYMFLINKFDLSYIVPVATGATYILTILSSKIIFNEIITTWKLVGSFFILIGVLLVNINKQ